MDHGRPLSNVRQLTVELPGSRSGPGRSAIGASCPFPLAAAEVG